MRLLIYEPDHVGHYLAYVRLLVEAAADLPVEIVVAVSDTAAQSAEFAVQLVRLSDQIALDRSVPGAGPAKRQPLQARIENMHRLIAQYKPDQVWVPHGDGMPRAIGRPRPFRRYNWGKSEVQVALLHGGYAYPGLRVRTRLRWIREHLTLPLVPWHTIFMCDPLGFDYLQRSLWRPSCRLQLMPDPVDKPLGIGRAAARTMLGIPTDGRYIGCVGLIDRRKGCDLLVRAFAQASCQPCDKLLFVGRVEARMRESLAGQWDQLLRDGRLVHIDEYVDNERFLAAIEALDVVCTPYPRHIGSASIVIRGAAAQRYVLSCDYGWMGRAAGSLGIGESVKVTDIAAFAAAIPRALARSAQYELTPQARQYIQFSGYENFAATWTARLRERLR